MPDALPGTTLPIYPGLGQASCCLHTRWLGCQPLRFPEFKNSRWMLATILKKENHDIAAMASPISVKFGTMMHPGPPQLVACKN